MHQPTSMRHLPIGAALRTGQESGMARDSFRFISILTPASSKDRANHNSARSHGARQSHIARRRKLIACQENFKILTPQDLNGSTTPPNRQGSHAGQSSMDDRDQRALVIGIAIALSNVDVDARMAQTLLGHPRARQALDPVFNISNTFQHQRIEAVTRDGLRDPVVAAGIAMTLVLAANGEIVNTDFLALKHRAICQISERLSEIKCEHLDGTIAAIILLVGVEWRLGSRNGSQLHLEGLQRLVKECDSRSIPLGDGLKRALFWQDLLSAMTIGTPRTLSHDSFSELHWERDQARRPYTLPPGFTSQAYLLNSGLRTALEDIYDLQVKRALTPFSRSEARTIRQVDNQQASIESRLFEQYQDTAPNAFVTRSVIMPAYLVTYVLFAEIWAAEWIPAHCSSLLLRTLQEAETVPCWRDAEKLLAWVFVVGASLAPTAHTRLQYARLLHGAYRDALEPYLRSWDQLKSLLEEFLWSEEVFDERAKQMLNAVI